VGGGGGGVLKKKRKKKRSIEGSLCRHATGTRETEKKRSANRFKKGDEGRRSLIQEKSRGGLFRIHRLRQIREGDQESRAAEESRNYLA